VKNLDETVLIFLFDNNEPARPNAIGGGGVELYEIAFLKLQTYLPAHRASSSVITGCAGPLLKRGTQHRLRKRAMRPASVSPQSRQVE